MDTMAISGKTIKALREARAWSQAHLAEAAGLSLRTVQRMEAEGTASAETRLAVAAALDVPVESLNPPAAPTPVIEPGPDDGGAAAHLLVFVVSAAGILYSMWLGSTLPPVVASHFGVTGEANGFMTRDQFVGLMLFVLGGVPLLMQWGMTRALRKRKTLRIPDAAYWLAEPRRPATERWLRRHFALFCAALPMFLAWVFWLVARANREAPAHPMLDNGSMLASLAVFLAATAAWVAVLNRHFRR
ncbi:MAG: helix-turn-helix domain-containing protein [Burkholderiaceae bacterium]